MGRSAGDSARPVPGTPGRTWDVVITPTRPAEVEAVSRGAWGVEEWWWGVLTLSGNLRVAKAGPVSTAGVCEDDESYLCGQMSCPTQRRMGRGTRGCRSGRCDVGPCRGQGVASQARSGVLGAPGAAGRVLPPPTSLPPLSSQLRRQAGVAAGSVVLCPETVQRGKEHPVQHLYGSAWPRSALGAGTVCAAWEPRSTDAGPQGREGRGTALSIMAGLGGNRPLIPLSQCHPRVLCGPPASMSPRNLKSSGLHPRLMEGTLFVQPSTGPCARRRGGGRAYTGRGPFTLSLSAPFPQFCGGCSETPRAPPGMLGRDLRP